MERKADPNLPQWSAYLGKLSAQAKPAAELPPAAAVAPLPPASSKSAEAAPARRRFALGIWNYYFIAKFILFGMGLIAFHLPANLAFAALILLLSSAGRQWRLASNALLVPLGIALLYHDSWLPPLGRALSQASLISGFSAGYFAELLTRFVNWSVVGLLALAGIVSRFASPRLRLAPLVLAGMLGIGVFQHLPASGGTVGAMPDMNQMVQNFFNQEAQRSVALTAPAANATPFDIIFLHVCSLSWDDVRAAGLENHPLWRRFDILFSQFNSATSYSGPSAIHLLRATCGQQAHDKMYTPVAEKCYLMNSLLRAGFEPNLALNHDGKFDNFIGQLQTYGRLTAPPLPLDGVSVAQHAFDGTPVYDDLSVLNRWLERRQQSDVARVALYYNTISLHDGNRTLAQPSGNSLETYRGRLSKLLDNMEQFMNDVEQSGRRAVVVMVPEHGAAIRGDKKQIAGLREIPTPAITLVPVGVKVIGGNLRRNGDTVSVDIPTSYLAIAQLIENMLEKSPFSGGSYTPADYVAGLPTTQFVAQNENATVAAYDHRYFAQHDSSGWEAWPAP